MRLAFILSIVATIMIIVSSCDRGDVQEGFVVLMDAHPRGLDPRFANTHASAQLVYLLYDGLVTTDTMDGQPQLRLAKRIDLKTDTLYEVELRDDIYFHDGQPVTVADVEYTIMDLASDLVNSPIKGMTARISRFEKTGPRTFELELHEPHAAFVADMALGIVPKHICDGHKECPGDPIGAGPFRFESRPGHGLYTFVANDAYYLGRPPIDRLHFRVVADDNTRMLALLGNTADLVQNAVQPLMLPVVERSDRLEVNATPSFKYTYLAFNLEHPPLDQLPVRQAIAHAIDRESIISYKFAGLATLSTGLLPPNHWAYNPETPTYDYNPARAIELLEEAGFTPDDDGVRLRLEFKVSSNKFRRSLAELKAHQLRDVGIEVTVRSFEWGTFFADVQSGNFQLTSLQWPSVQEPGMYRWIFHSENIPSPQARAAGGNRGRYRNARIDELTDLGNTTMDQEKRRDIYAEVQTILAQDLPYVSLWHEDNIAITKKGVKGYVPTPNARLEALTRTTPAPR